MEIRVIHVTKDMKSLQLGRLGENDTLQFVFDVSDWMERYPGCTIGLVNRLPKADEGYPCVIESLGDGKMGWTITSSELTVAGKGKCQLQAVLTGAVEKSKSYDTEVLEAIDNSGTAPDPWTSYVTQVTEAAGDAEAYAVGTRNGVDVDSSDPAYHNNSKYYAEDTAGTIAGKADKVEDAVEGNFAALDENGNLTDSGSKASDFLTSHQDISGKADKVTSATNGNFAGLDGNGNLTDSGHKHSDYITSHQDISGKADKVSSATNGNFAGLDSNGNLTDSGHKHSDYLTAHQDITGKADKVSGATSGNFAGLDSNGNLTDSGSKASDFGTYSKPSGGIPGTDLADSYIEEPASEGTSGQVLTTDGNGGRSWTTVQVGDVSDVKVNGTSVVTNGVANIPLAGSSTLGVVKVNSSYGIGTVPTQNEILKTVAAVSQDIKSGSNGYMPIVPGKQHEATFYGLAKAAGDSSQSLSSNAVGTYTADAKAAIQSMLGVPGDVQVNGTSVVNNGVANIPVATSSAYGVAKYEGNILGVKINSSGFVQTQHAETSDCKAGTNAYKPIVPVNQDNAVFYGLAKAAGDSSQSSSNNAVGTYTDGAKSAIQSMLDVPARSVLADAFSTSTTYAVGDYVEYGGKIYECTTAHTGAWDANDFVETNMGDELGSLKNAINSSYENIAPVEASATATSAHAVGELFILNDKLLVALSAIAVGDTITTEGNSPNAAVTTLSAKLIKDVQINGNSILSNGVANIPYPDSNNAGVIKTSVNYGVYNGSSGVLMTNLATSDQVKEGTNAYRPIVPYNQHSAAFYGMAKAAGDTTQKSSSNAVGTYTEDAKSKISDMLNAPETVSGTTPVITAKSGIRYICGECATLDITAPASGIIDVVFESGSTPTVLTVTPPTGITAVKWANGFDPTSLEANTKYEISIMDGELGAALSWT